MSDKLPDDVMILLEQFVRDMTRRHVGVFGLAFTVEPPAAALIRNEDGDPVEQAESVLNIVQSAYNGNRIIHHDIKPVN